jgi:DNA replicative helicase MCM subunit Mcm2 (Cdc46/Mcm family)
MKIIKQETEMIGEKEFSVTYFSADGVNVTGVLKQLKNEAEHEKTPTQLDNIEKNQLIIMEAIAEQYEISEKSN